MYVTPAAHVTNVSGEISNGLSRYYIVVLLLLCVAKNCSYPMFLTALTSRSYCTTSSSGRKSLTMNCIKTGLLVDASMLHELGTSSTNTFLRMPFAALVRAFTVLWSHKSLGFNVTETAYC